MEIRWRNIIFFLCLLIVIAIIVHPSKFYLGWRLVKSGRISEGIKGLQEASDKFPKSLRITKALAETAARIGLNDEAERQYEHLLELQPRDEYFLDAIRFYQWIRHPQEELKMLKRWYAFRLKEGSGFDDVAGDNLIDRYYNLSINAKDFQSAIMILKDRLKIQNNFWHEMEKDILASFLLDLDTKTKNISDYTVIYDDEVTIVGRELRRDLEDDLLSLLEQTGNLTEALALTKKKLRENREDFVALEKFAEIAPLVGQVKEAEYLLRNRANSDPEDITARVRYINFLEQQGNTTQIFSAYRSWIPKYPHNSELVDEGIGLFTAYGNGLELISILEQLPLSERSRPDVGEYLVMLYEQNDLKDKLAEELLARFHKHNGTPDELERLGWLLIDLKRYEEARQILEKIVTLFPANSQIFSMLVEVNDRLGNFREGNKILEDSARDMSDPDIMKTLGKRLLWGDSSEKLASNRATKQ